jgi:hypothetical protein
MMWGWLWHLTLGIAYWILPRFGADRPRSWLVGMAFACLNAGIWLTALVAWLSAPWLSVAGGLLQLLAALAFALHAWPRVRASAYGK